MRYIHDLYHSYAKSPFKNASKKILHTLFTFAENPTIKSVKTKPPEINVRFFMRYYSFSVITNEEQIKKETKIRLNDYCYDNPVAAVNGFIQKNTVNNMSFFIYGIEGEIAKAVFAFDEQKNTLQSVLDDICGLLKTNFNVGFTKCDPVEITMCQFKDVFMEAKRHEYLIGAGHKIADVSHLWVYYLSTDEERQLPFDMEECIATTAIKDLGMFDRSFSNELANIENNRLEVAEDVNMAHYIISGNSRKAEYKLAETLVSKLYDANRLTSRRVVFISELKPRFYDKDIYVETIIENNYGGTVVIDLTEKFGYSPSEYVDASRYIEKLFKKHGNHCLFIFTYNKNATGYSYYLLPELGKSLITVNLREGHGSRKSALLYLKSLIRESEYSEYTRNAGEFLKLYDGSDFTQTEIIEAFERFGPWVINKKVKGIYSFNTSGDYMLDRDEDTETSSEKLEKLIGLHIVKKQIESIIASDVVEKERKKHSSDAYKSISSHMIFAGNPGSAKTTVAELFAGVAKEKGLLKSGTFISCGGMDLDGMFCVSAIRNAFTSAKGGVLFIDEAYSMQSKVAIATLIQEMENQRDNVIVILAGYNEKMRAFIDLNEGLKSRIPHWVDFPDYSTDELTDIFKYMLDERRLSATDDAIQAARLIFDRTRIIENFGNGRFVRNLLDRALLNQSSRLMSTYITAEKIPQNELYVITKEDISSLHEDLVEAREPGEAKAELEAMIGLTSAKAVINKALAKFKLDKMCMDKGIQRARGTMHMVYTGNPGTAKTTVARLCAEILADEKILSTGNFVEVGRADLVGNVVGSTARLVKQKFKEAQGGVLFIDEAYSLCDYHEGSFGDEAINTIVQEMENHREDVVVIFAGYPKPMADFLDRNPGMKSRIAFHVKFDDYTTDELCRITELMVSKKQMTLTSAAMDKLRASYEAAKVNTDFGNGRFVRKLLEEAEMNQATRVVMLPETELTPEVITTIEECDIPDFTVEKKTKAKIGFAC